MLRRTRTVLLCLVAPAVGIAAFISPLSWQTELDTIEARFEIRGSRPQPPDVVAFVLDKKAAKRIWGATSGAEQRKEPLRAALGDAVRRIADSGARAVVVSMAFSAVDPKGSSTDNQFLENLATGGRRVVIGVACPVPDTQASESRAFRRAGVRTGSLCVNAFDKARQVVFQVGAEPGIAIAAARAAGVPVPAAAFRPEPELDPFYRWAWIDFAGAGGIIAKISLAKIIDGIPSSTLRSLVAGKVVVVDFSGGYPGELVYDSPAPGGDGTVSSAELTGNAMATMLAGFPLRDAPRWLAILLIAFCGVLGPVSALKVQPSRWAMIIGLQLVALLIALQLAFNAGMIMPAVATLLGLFAAIPMAMLISYRSTRLELGEMRRRFAGADPSAVEAVLKGTVISGAAASEAIVPGYRIEASIGRGGSGNVYRATKLDSGDVVALKVIKPLLAEDSATRAQFEREIKAAKRFAHPKAVPIIDGGGVDGVLYICSPYIQDGDLQEAINEGKLLTASQLQLLAEDIGSALDAAHDAGLIHRDVKPSNVFRSADGFLIADFGIARMSGEATISDTGGTVGTLAYAAPEQLDGHGYISPATDVYGLAGTIVAAGSGHPPYSANSVSETLAAKVRGAVPTVGETLAPAAQILARALSVDPGERQESCSELAAELAEALRRGGGSD